MYGPQPEREGVKIYLACGLSHIPRDLFSDYAAYLHRLAQALRTIRNDCTVKYALLNSDPQLAEKPPDDRASLCYAWDRRMVEEADIVVADASFPSTGLGVELQIADTRRHTNCQAHWRLWSESRKVCSLH
jgi:hypothetical protein